MNKYPEYSEGITTPITGEQCPDEPTMDNCEVCYQPFPAEDLKMRDVNLLKITGKKTMTFSIKNLLACDECGEFYKPQ